MREILLCLTLAALLVTAGCSTAPIPRRSAPAPVVRSEPPPAPQVLGRPDSAAAPESIPYPARNPIEPELTPYSDVQSRPPPPISAEPRAPVSTGNSAVVALLSSADKQQRGGDTAGAAATLERALRIEPRNARLWHQLALLRFEQQNYRMAADLADKSNSLAQNDGELTRANWRLIARARSALGDSAGARRAQQMAQ